MGGIKIMSIFIGGAWPYANGSLHLGHLASLLPGDILARYFRLNGEDVLYVSGSDCHGTPIALKAAGDNISPENITNKYHEQFKECFDKLGFTYDFYSRTDQKFHHQLVKNIFVKLKEKGHIYKKEADQIYCQHCDQFLPDRYVEGECPECGEVARGDQCDHCSTLIDPVELEKKTCKLCGREPKIKNTNHFYFALSEFEEELSDFLNNLGDTWRENAVELTDRYIREGLQDRAITRDLDWGIEVPVEGYNDKKIYVWVEAVLGYLSASKQWAEERIGDKKEWKNYWTEEDITAYFVHGKDNIPFHSLILPALLKGLDSKYHLPDRIISSEYLLIEGKKLSTSRNWAIWVPYILDKYHPDSIRYYLSINGPEKRDCNFSWSEFIHSHNGELLGAYGNFVNRVLVFVEKKFDSKIPEGQLDPKIEDEISYLYNTVGRQIEDGEFKQALEDIFAFIRKMNKYFDREKPWITIKEDKELCRDTIFNCVQVIANLSTLFSPFLPFSSEKVKGFLDLKDNGWELTRVNSGRELNKFEILFDRIEKKQIEKEREKLQKRAD